MLQAEHDRFHGHPALQAEARRGEEHQAGQQAPHQMSVVSLLRLHLAGLGRQQVLQRAEGLLNPTAPAPSPDQAWRRNGRLPAEQVEAFFPCFVDQHECDTSIGGTRGREPGIAAPRRLRALPPRPVGWGPEVCPGDPTPIGQREDVPPFALHKPRPSQVRLDVGHQGRVSKPTIRHDQRRWQPSAPPLQDRPCPIQHDLPPRQLIAAGSAGPHGVWAADDEVHRDDQLPVATHHHQQQPIDPQPHTMFLATIPGAHQPQLLASLLEHAIVRHPRPLPPTGGRRALVRNLLPQPDQEGLAALLQLPDPLLLGQRPQEAAGEMLIPDPDLRQLVGTPAPKQGGEHHPKDVSQQLYPYGSLIFSTVFNIWQICEITEFLKVDSPSALYLFGALDPSVYCGVAVRLYEDSENQRVIGQCLELVQK
jgi:hypothetical protein